MDILDRAMRTALGVSVVATLLLTFVWPLAVSSDPAHPGFRVAAIVTFALFFLALIGLLAVRLARSR